MERSRSRTSTGSDEQSAGNLFELFDRDNSGSIDIHELRNVFASSSLDLNEYQVAQLLRLADFDKSGRIEAHEVCVQYSQNKRNDSMPLIYDNNV